VSGSPVWAIPAGVESDLPEAAGLRSFCEQHRSNDLILVEPHDGFYSSDLPFARLRYCWVAPERPAGAQPPPLDFDWLGVSTTVAQYNQLEAWRPVFRRRMEYFNLSSDRAVATAILPHSLAELRILIEAHPEADFYLPESVLRSLEVTGARQVVPGGSGMVFLLAPTGNTYPAARSCRF
jgi:hypothetical protein